jgi:hypothetical protein
VPGQTDCGACGGGQGPDGQFAMLVEAVRWLDRQIAVHSATVSCMGGRAAVVAKAHRGGEKRDLRGGKWLGRQTDARGRAGG